MPHVDFINLPAVLLNNESLFPQKMPQSEELTIEFLRTRKESFAIEGEYSRLYESLSHPNAYLSPEWVYTWLLSLGRKYEVYFITCRLGGRLIGVWPFFECPLRVLGTALMPAAAHAGDLFDPIAEELAQEPLLQALCGAVKEFSFAWLPLVSMDFTRRVLQPYLLEKRVPGLLRKRAPRILIGLDRFKDFNSYLETIFGPKTRQNLRRKIRRLGEEGEVAVLSLQTPEEITPWMDEVMTMERTCWKGRKGVGIFQRADYRAFYKLLMQNLAERGRFRLSLLTVGGRLAAYEIGVLGSDSYCMHSMAYNHEFKAYSPGRLLMLRVVEKCIEERRNVYDFMQNDQEFKRQMSTHQSSLWDLIVFPQSLKGYVLMGAIKVVYLWTEWLRRRNPSKPSPEPEDEESG